MRVCKKCQVEKNESEFSVTDKHYGYLKSSCKACEAERVKAYYHSNENFRTRAQQRSRGENVPLVLNPKATQWDEETQTKVCTDCKIEMPLSSFSRSKSGVFGRCYRCKECQKAKNREGKESGRWASFTTEGQRKYRLQKKYGMTPEQYEDMLEQQGGRCKICGTTDCGAPPHKHGAIRDKMVVDHDHDTGKVRGLLCYSCNVWLGNFEVLVKRSSVSHILEYLGLSSKEK